MMHQAIILFCIFYCFPHELHSLTPNTGSAAAALEAGDRGKDERAYVE